MLAYEIIYAYINFAIIIVIIVLLLFPILHIILYW